MWLPVMGACVLFVTFVYGASLFINGKRTQGNASRLTPQDTATAESQRLASLLNAIQRVGDDAVAGAFGMNANPSPQQRQAPTNAPTQQAKMPQQPIQVTPLQAEALAINKLLRDSLQYTGCYQLEVTKGHHCNATPYAFQA